MISIIIIDDGISIDSTRCGMLKVQETYCVNENRQVCKCKKNINQEDTHGGLCAYIIQDIFPEVYFISITILNNNGKCDGEKLKIALEWCVKQKCDIIHMSLSTRNFYTCKLIENTISNLLKQNKLIVSAIDNAGVVSYPAAFENVFAVYMDNYENFAKKKLGLFYDMNLESYMIGVQYNKRIVKNNGEILYLDSANSYAAAAVTGYLAKFISFQKNRNVKEIRKMFIKSIYDDSNCVWGKLPQIKCEKKSRNVPVIAIVDKDIWWLKKIYDYYTAEGYYVVAFTEKNSENFIPLRFYLENQIIIDEVFACDMEELYKPDLLIFQVGNKNQIQLEEVEILLYMQDERIEVCEEGDKICFQYKEEAFRYIVNGLERNSNE